MILGALAVATIALAIGYAAPTRDRAEAHSLPFKWNPGVNALVGNGNTSYGANITYTVSQWGSTDAPLQGTCGPGACGNVIYYQGYYSTVWVAGAVQYTNIGGSWDACTDFLSLNPTGNCDTTGNTATFAYVYLNTKFQSAINAEPSWITTHEMGHVFGLAHNTTTSVMKTSTPHYLPITSHDIGDMNALY